MRLNMGDLFEAVAQIVPPEHDALIHGDDVISWAELDRRSNQLGHALLNAGLGPNSKVAFYMRNQSAYMETLIACLKSRLVHVNVNYRFQTEELSYLFDNSDAEAVVYDAEFRSLIEVLRPRHAKVKLWIETQGPDDGFAQPYAKLLEQGDASPVQLKRSPNDQLFIYTGGTTGMPKGVIWHQADLLTAQFNSLAYLENSEPPKRLEQVLARIRKTSMYNRQLPAAPLMHATAVVVAFGAILGGGCVVTLPSHGFDADALWRAVEKHRVTTLTIVGDAFAKPMLKALEQKALENRHYDLSSLKGIISSGVIWSQPVKQAMLDYLPEVMLLDNFGSTEAPACGTAITTKAGGIRQPIFRVGEDCKVFSEDNREIQPGSGEAGLIGRAGPIPQGYYKDPEKTAQTFRTINGVRYAMPGDYCIVEPDGTLTLLGRGSQCINSGGEKVFVEEVEETIKQHPAVADALVLGTPDERWGQAVTAVVKLHPGASANEQQIQQQVREHLAGYKVPKQVLFNDRIERLPNGKADYRAAKTFVEQTLLKTARDAAL